jgi:hypothetical protein
MPYAIRIISSRDFLQLDAEGHFDLPMTQRLLCDAMWACVRSGIGRVLIDVRDATTDLTAAQLCSLADVCNQVSHPPGDYRIALLRKHKPEFDRAAFLAAMVKDQGWNIAAFQDFETAFHWLNC